MDQRTFYVYEHWRPDRDECFYVGKGRGIRAHNMSRRNAHHKAIQAKLTRLGMTVEVRLVATGISQEQAYKIEIERIKFWKESHVDLTNKSDGGDGNSGYRHTDKAKAKISLRNITHNIKPPTGVGAANPFFGKKHSEATKARLSKIAKGRVLSEETKAKLSNLRKEKGVKPPSPLGRRWTEEQKMAQSERIKAVRRAQKELI